MNNKFVLKSPMATSKKQFNKTKSFKGKEKKACIKV